MTPCDHLVRRTRLRHRLAILFTLAVVGCGMGRRGVVRLVDGREIEGRLIGEEAYALYARAAVLEASGQELAALAAYSRVLEYDPWSAEVWIRKGALLCRTDPARADAAFAEAARIDAGFEPLWRERARCFIRTGALERARDAASRALRLDPDRVDTSLLLVEAYDRLGRYVDARRWLLALVQRSPTSPAAWRAAIEFAMRHGDRELEHQARSHLARLRPGSKEASPAATRGAAIDDALIAHDLEGARALAIEDGVPAAEVALRAAALARPKLAREQALLVLKADPRNGDAWIAALVAADLDRDVGLMEEVSVMLDSEPIHPSPLGARLLSELLSRRIGAEAAEAWLTGYGPLQLPE